MKAIMYHYVRPERTDLPYHRYLHVDDFCRQLDWLEQTCGFVSREEFNRALATGTPVDATVAAGVAMHLLVVAVTGLVAAVGSLGLARRER